MDGEADEDHGRGPDDDHGPLPTTMVAAVSVPLDHAVVRALATGAAPGQVIEHAANAVRVLCPDRGVAVWWRGSDGVANVQAAGIGAHLVMITGDPDSPFWDRARREDRPNYQITFQARPEDGDLTSVWCIPAGEGPAAGDVMVVAVGHKDDTGTDDGVQPDDETRTWLTHLTRLIGIGVDRKHLVDRLEKANERPDGPGPEVEMGMTPTSGDADEQAGTVLFYIRLSEIRDVAHIHGHKAAEDLTTEVGRRLSRLVRPGDSVGRLSETDFALRCYRVTAIQAESIVARVLDDLWTPVVTRWEETRLRPRVGLARAAHPTPLSTLLKQADEARRQADEIGRDWLWTGTEVDPPPRALGPGEVGNGFGAGSAHSTEPGPPPDADADQSDPGLLADSSAGSAE